jgi:hypothetical protein
MQNKAETVASFSIKASTLRSVVSAYAAIQDEFHWLFTREGVEARALDSSRVAMIEFILRPPNYRSGVDRVWVFGSVTELAKIVRRFKKAEEIAVEVREDDHFYVGPFKIGSKVSEEDVPEWSKPKPLTIRPDCKLTVVTSDFRRIVRHAEAEKTREIWKPERAYEHVGIRVSGGEATIVFFNEESSRIDVKGYQPWILSIEREGVCTYSLPLFSSLLILGLSDVVDLEFQNKGILQITYNGDDYQLRFWLAPELDTKTNDVLPRFIEVLEKPKSVRKQLWTLREEEVKLLEKSVKAMNYACRGEEVHVGMEEERFLLYWNEYDRGYFQVPRAMFWEWHPPPDSLSGTFRMSDLAKWLKNVEELTLFLEGEPPEALLFLGKGAKIPPKEMRSEEFPRKVDIPEVKGTTIFSGSRSILRNVTEDAETAEDVFLLLVSTPFEIEAFGRDAVYYRATLPLDSFQTIEENYIPINSSYFGGLKGFFTNFPAANVTLGKEDSNILIEAETKLGEFKAVIMQTVEEAKEATEAYEEEFLKPPPPPPPEVRPLQPPAVTPSPTPPAKISREGFLKSFDDELIEWMQHYIKLRTPGLRGELHYEAPKFEEETIAKFTEDTVREKWREDVSKEREDAYKCYEEAKPEVAKIRLEKVPDHASWLANKLVKATERQLLEEVKRKAREKVPPVELPPPRAPPRAIAPSARELALLRTAERAIKELEKL